MSLEEADEHWKMGAGVGGGTLLLQILIKMSRDKAEEELETIPS